MHFTYAGQNRHKGSNHRQKASENDRCAAVLFEKHAGPLNVLLVEKNRIIFIKNPVANFIAKSVPHAIPQDCPADDYPDQKPDIQEVLGRQNSGCKKQTIPGKKKTKKQSGLCKNNCEQPKISRGFDKHY